MSDEIGRRQPVTIRPAAVDLSRPALETMAFHGLADLATRGLAEPGGLGAVGKPMEYEVRAALAPAFGVTAAVIAGLAKRLASPESLATPLRGLCGLRDACRHHGGGQTVRRLRPLRRRRERTLRPFFVLIRSRKPCVFLRRRLLG